MNNDRICAIVCMIFVRPILHMGQCRKEREGEQINLGITQKYLLIFISYYFSYSFAYHDYNSSDQEQAKA